MEGGPGQEGKGVVIHSFTLFCFSFLNIYLLGCVRS